MAWRLPEPEDPEQQVRSQEALASWGEFGSSTLCPVPLPHIALPLRIRGRREGVSGLCQECSCSRAGRGKGQPAAKAGWEGAARVEEGASSLSLSTHPPGVPLLGSMGVCAGVGGTGHLPGAALALEWESACPQTGRGVTVVVGAALWQQLLPPPQLQPSNCLKICAPQPRRSQLQGGWLSGPGRWGMGFQPEGPAGSGEEENSSHSFCTPVTGPCAWTAGPLRLRSWQFERWGPNELI